MLQGKTIGFLGAGSIAEALIRGLLAQGVVWPGQMVVSNRASRERLDFLSRRFGVRATRNKLKLVRDSDVLVVACKPKDVPALLEEVGGRTHKGQIVLSIAAGVSTEFIADHVAEGVQVVRAMPNTSSQVGESATAFCLGAGAGEEARSICSEILGAVGHVTEVAEPLIDSVTGLSGSGPAYVYLMIEAMIEAGKGVGLAPETARDLAVQTLKGAAKMLSETDEDPAVLRQKVTSPGGTTMAGLQELNDAGFKQALVRAVARATQRSRELGALATAPQAVANR